MQNCNCNWNWCWNRLRNLQCNCYSKFGADVESNPNPFNHSRIWMEGPWFHFELDPFCIPSFLLSFCLEKSEEEERESLH